MSCASLLWAGPSPSRPEYTRINVRVSPKQWGNDREITVGVRGAVVAKPPINKVAIASAGGFAGTIVAFGLLLLAQRAFAARRSRRLRAVEEKLNFLKALKPALPHGGEMGALPQPRPRPRAPPPPQDDEDVAEALCFKPSWGGTAAGGLGGRRARAAAARRASGGSDDDDDEEALVIVRGAERGALD